MKFIINEKKIIEYFYYLKIQTKQIMTILENNFLIFKFKKNLEIK